MGEHGEDSEDGAAAGSASDTAYAGIKARILDGDLAGGRMVSEGELAAELGMSRTPVREAFLRLQAEGWMRLYPKRGALILEPAAGEIDDVLDARVLLERHAVETIAGDPDAVAALVARLRVVLAGQRSRLDADDLGGFADADAEFHATIIAAGGNALLTGFYGGLRERQRRMSTRSVWRRTERAQRIVVDHAGLIDAIESRDTAAFASELVAHLLRSHKPGRG